MKTESKLQKNNDIKIGLTFEELSEIFVDLANTVKRNSQIRICDCEKDCGECLCKLNNE